MIRKCMHKDGAEEEVKNQWNVSIWGKMGRLKELKCSVLINNPTWHYFNKQKCGQGHNHYR